jgi:arsenate reductase (thioredoxin)
MMSEPTVLFVCLHGAAKSVLAAAHFQRLADQRGLGVRADFAGTEPDPVIAPRVLAALRNEGIDLGAQRPTRVTPEAMARAWRVISFGCDLEDLAPGARIVRWDDVPAVSEDYDTARAAIDTRVARLLHDYQREITT